MKYIGKITALLMALLLLISALTGCQKAKGDAEQTTAAVAEAATTDSSVKLNLPKLDYEGAELQLLVGTQMLQYFHADGTGDVINAATYERNAAVADHLNVNLAFSHIDGYSSGATDFTTAIRTSAMSDGFYDIVVPTQSFGNTLIVEGIYTNLYDYEYLNFEEGYWWDGYTDQAEIGGKLYTAAGDFTPGALMSLQVIYMNRSFLKDYPDMEDPYTLVKNNQWTLEKMLTLSASISQELDGDGVWDADDRYGLTMVNNGLANMPTASGVHYVDKTASGYVYSLASDKSITLVETIRAAIQANTIRYFRFDNDAMSDAFMAGKALFCINSLTDVYDIKASTLEYGILVPPKYDAAQTEYSVGAGGLNVCAITEGVDEARAIRASAVLQAFGYYSYQILTPALFENFLRGQAALDPQTYEMLGLIRESAYYDIGMIYGRVFNVVGMYHQCIDKEGKTVTTWWEENGTAAEQTLKDWLISIQNMA